MIKIGPKALYTQLRPRPDPGETHVIATLVLCATILISDALTAITGLYERYS